MFSMVEKFDMDRMRPVDDSSQKSICPSHTRKYFTYVRSILFRVVGVDLDLSSIISSPRTPVVTNMPSCHVRLIGIATSVNRVQENPTGAR